MRSYRKSYIQYIKDVALIFLFTKQTTSIIF